MGELLLDEMIVRGQKQIIASILTKYIDIPYDEANKKIDLYSEKYFDAISEECFLYNESDNRLYPISSIDYSYQTTVGVNEEIDSDVIVKCSYHKSGYDFEEFVNGTDMVAKSLFSNETYTTIMTKINDEDSDNEYLLYRRLLYRAYTGYHIFLTVSSIIYFIIGTKSSRDNLSILSDTVANAFSWNDIVNTSFDITINPVFYIDEDGFLCFNDAIICVK